VHFQIVHDHVAGNYSPSMLPVTDETILAIRRAKWSSVPIKSGARRVVGAAHPAAR
jgi:hypothetical protein